MRSRTMELATLVVLTTVGCGGSPDQGSDTNAGGSPAGDPSVSGALATGGASTGGSQPLGGAGGGAASGSGGLNATGATGNAPTSGAGTGATTGGGLGGTGGSTGAGATGGNTGGSTGSSGGTGNTGGSSGGLGGGSTGGADDGGGTGGSSGGAGATGGSTGGTQGGTGGSSGGTGGTDDSGGTGNPTGGTGDTGGSLGGTGGIDGGTGGTGGAGGSTGGEGGSGDGSGGTQACAHECVDQCVPWGGTEREGTCEGEQACCEGATVPQDNPLAHLIPSAEEVGLLLANRFNQQPLGFSSVAEVEVNNGRYKYACEWYGALGVAGLTGSESLLGSLVTKFDPLKTNFVADMTGGEAHVDRYVFGIVPLEIYLQTGDETCLSIGTQTADTQQTTNQTRGAIDDMFMMPSLQVQAYRATGDDGYLTYMAGVMVDYLGEQQGNGLFFHNVTEARVHWGRGNGWFAAGMAEIMRDLPEGPGDYQTIENGYLTMMENLLPLQGPNGLWYQVLDLPNDPGNWEETSCTGMITYAMVAGVRRGILDAAIYVPVIEAAWEGLQSKISPQGDVSDICTGTWYHSTPQEYMALERVTGDGHGQAPVLWVAAELLR